MSDTTEVGINSKTNTYSKTLILDYFFSCKKDFLLSFKMTRNSSSFILIIIGNLDSAILAKFPNKYKVYKKANFENHAI